MNGFRPVSSRRSKGVDGGRRVLPLPTAHANRHPNTINSIDLSLPPPPSPFEFHLQGSNRRRGVCTRAGVCVCELRVLLSPDHREAQNANKTHTQKVRRTVPVVSPQQTKEAPKRKRKKRERGVLEIGHTAIDDAIQIRLCLPLVSLNTLSRSI